MQILPYFLIILGIIFIVLAFVLPDQDQKKKQEITEKERADILAQEQKEIDGILQDKTDDVIEKVDEQLSRISNEKIISVSEYSDEVLEKINQNHQEVVFLYNMLNEKEEEMKKMMVKMKPVTEEDTPGGKQAEKLAKKVERSARKAETDGSNRMGMADPRRAEMTALNHMGMAVSNQMEMDASNQMEMDASNQTEMTASNQMETSVQRQMEERDQMSAWENDDMDMLRDLLDADGMDAEKKGMGESVTGEKGIGEKNTGEKNTKERNGNIGKRRRNREWGALNGEASEASGGATGLEEGSISNKVLELYKSGMDVLEISRTLKKGRGEVQLIIDLYGKRRRG